MQVRVECGLRWLAGFILALGLMVLVPAGHAQGKASGVSTNKPPVTAENAGSTDLLHSGDKITVILADIPNGPLIHDQTITEDGYITLHYNVKIKADGRTKSDVQEDIRAEYVDRKKIYLRITVTVKSEERYFFVDGQVKTPNRYPYNGELTVLKAITAAGGFTDFAKKSKVQVIRVNGKTEIVNCDKAKDTPKLDLPIYPGDRIDVPRRYF